MKAEWSRRPSAAVTIAAATVAAWLSIIAVALAFDDSSTRDRSAAPRDPAIHAPDARPGRAGPGYVQVTPDR
jgi:hypothetical protein